MYIHRHGHLLLFFSRKWGKHQSFMHHGKAWMLALANCQLTKHNMDVSIWPSVIAHWPSMDVSTCKMSMHIVQCR